MRLNATRQQPCGCCAGRSAAAERDRRAGSSTRPRRRPSAPRARGGTVASTPAELLQALGDRTWKRSGSGSRRARTLRTRSGVERGRAPAAVPGRRRARSVPAPKTRLPTACGCSAATRRSSGEHRLAARLPLRRGLAAALHARHRLREPQGRERRQGPMGALPTAVADAAGQAYLLTGEENALRRACGRCSRAGSPPIPTRSPSTGRPRWRRRSAILSWSWLFHVFHASRAWQDAAFASASCAHSTCMATSPSATSSSRT